MTKDVALRYPSAAELRADLLRFERGRPLVGGPLPGAAPVAAAVVAAPSARQVRAQAAAPRRPAPCPRAPVPPPRRRRRWGAAVFVSIAFGLLIALIVTLLVQSDFGERREDRSSPRRSQGHQRALPDRRGDARQRRLQGRPRRPGQHAPVGHGVAPGPGGRSATAQGRHHHARREQRHRAAAGDRREEPCRGDRVAEAEEHPGELHRRGRPRPAARHRVAHRSRRGHTDPEGLSLRRGRHRQGAAGRRPGRGDTRCGGGVVGVGSGRAQSRAHDEVGRARLDPGGQDRRHRSGAGTLLPRDSEVTLLISSGPALVEVPNTVGKTRAEAESTLTGARLSVRVSFRSVPAPQLGLVVEQSPADGELAPLSFVTITVGI